MILNWFSYTFVSDSSVIHSDGADFLQSIDISLIVLKSVVHNLDTITQPTQACLNLGQLLLRKGLKSEFYINMREISMISLIIWKKRNNRKALNDELPIVILIVNRCVCIILVFVNKQALYQTAQSSIQMAPIFSKQRHFFNCPVIKMIYVSLPDYKSICTQPLPVH
jgi:hypothetical protein